jgi:hypothetical protein
MDSGNGSDLGQPVSSDVMWSHLPMIYSDSSEVLQEYFARNELHDPCSATFLCACSRLGLGVRSLRLDLPTV